MTDRVTEVLADALKRALDDPAAERRLYKSGKLDGLFAGRGGAGGQAAARALAEGLLEPVRTETRGKALIEWVRLTPRGVDFLHEHESPVHALHELRSALRTNRSAIPVWLEDLRGSLGVLAERLDSNRNALYKLLHDARRRLRAHVAAAGFPEVNE